MKLFVVIPCYNEPNVVSSLQSIADCNPPTLPVTVIVVVNSELDCEPAVIQQNERSLQEIRNWQSTKPAWIELEILNIKDVPNKIAGVGNARKTGMDHGFELAEGKHDSILICYDADCTCTENYLTAIEDAFEANPNHDVATIYFEHNNLSSEAIVDYELFLRYHYQGLKYTGYPYAYQTIGSSMAVRADTYQQFGGMNQRKAGEDFYFLHKLIPYRQVFEINNCVVYPSSRTSDRVPFGTGHAVAKFDESICKTYYTYHPTIYAEIRKCIQLIEKATMETGLDVNQMPTDIQLFLTHQKFQKALIQFTKQTKSDVLFRQAIYRWLNGFRMLKLVHFLRDQSLTNIPIPHAVSQFWTMNYNTKLSLTNKEWLERFRKLEKG